jgi:hypothetical protein
MTAKNDSKNGTKSANVSNSKSGSSVELSTVMIGEKVKEEVKNEVLQIAAPKTLTFPERVDKVKSLYSLMEKHEKLTDSKNQLKTFNVGSDMNSAELIISDGKGSKFRTNNPLVIHRIGEMIKNLVDDQIQEVEDQLSF